MLIFTLYYLKTHYLPLKHYFKNYIKFCNATARYSYLMQWPFPCGGHFM